MTKKLNVPSPPDFENATQDDLSITEKHSWDKSKEIAQGEKKDWTNVDLITHQKNANTRNELKSIGKIVRFLMFLFCGLFVVFLCSWAWHFIMPECWHWLKSDKINKIQSIIFSGSLGAMASIYFRGK